MNDKTVERDGKVPVVIVKSFLFTRQDKTQESYEPGVRWFTREEAEHWYVRAHSDNPPPPAEPKAVPEFARHGRKRIEEARFNEPGGLTPDIARQRANQARERRKL